MAARKSKKKLKKSKKKLKKPKKGKLIKQKLEGIPAGSLQILSKDMKELLGKKPGIYALYNNKKLYYVGMAVNLHSRLKSHLRAKRSRKWNKISIFVITRTQYLKDVELAVVNISKPPGNRQKSKIPNNNYLKKKYNEIVRMYKKQIRSL